MPFGAGHEVHRAGDELPDSQARHEAGKGQVLAERHQMDLVYGVDDLAALVDGYHRIVVVPFAAGAGPSLGAYRSSQQQLARRQRVADGRQRFRTIAEEEGHGGFGPQDELRRLTAGAAPG